MTNTDVLLTMSRGEWTPDGATQPDSARRLVSGPVVEARLEPHQGSTHLGDIVNLTLMLARTYNAVSLAVPAASIELL